MVAGAVAGAVAVVWADVVFIAKSKPTRTKAVFIGITNNTWSGPGGQRRMGSKIRIKKR